MSALSQRDRELIAAHPLVGSLDHLLEPLRDVDEVYVVSADARDDTTSQRDGRQSPDCSPR